MNKMINKQDRLISQTLNCQCAKCGATIKISNRHESDVFSLSFDNILYFNCPVCRESFDVPFRNYSK